MPKYAYFNSLISTNSSVKGWFDTDEFSYPNLPPASDLLEITSAEWSERMTGQWAVSDGALVAYTPPVPAPTLTQQAAAAISAGLAITSTSTSSLDGLYSVDATAQQHVMAEITSIVLNGTFADGSSTVEWLDASGISHALTVAQFKTFATAISAYVAALTKCMLGQLADLPSTSATIA